MDEQLEFLKEIVSRLGSAKIRYMITGSTALSIYAVPRMTRDLDIVAELELKDIDRFVELFEKDCYIDRGSVLEAVTSRRMFNVIHNEWIVKADFIVRKDAPYHREAFERRRECDIGEMSLFVIAPEDLVLSKLLWIRESESEQQRRDIRNLIDSVEDIDWPYMEKWAEELGIKGLLEKTGS